MNELGEIDGWVCKAADGLCRDELTAGSRCIGIKFAQLVTVVARRSGGVGVALLSCLNRGMLLSPALRRPL